tara:strand:- start:477 stop:1142 length:666 start_codon:yes stop_codon:yes gene_type:complete
MSRYTFSLLLVMMGIYAVAQEPQKLTTVPESSGLRIGVDFAKYVYQIVEPSITGFEASLDYEIKPNYFITLEGGYEKALPQSDLYNYKLSGIYGRVGFDYNIRKKRADNDIFFLGLRYGLSNYTQSATDIQITNYWGNGIESVPSETLIAHWAEAVVGMKVELFFAKNLFIGWTVRGRLMLAGNNYETLEPFTIPGYGGADAKALVGATWSLYYNIPVRFN